MHFGSGNVDLHFGGWHLYQSVSLKRGSSHEIFALHSCTPNARFIGKCWYWCQLDKFIEFRPSLGVKCYFVVYNDPRDLKIIFTTYASMHPKCPGYAPQIPGLIWRSATLAIAGQENLFKCSRGSSIVPKKWHIKLYLLENALL